MSIVYTDVVYRRFQIGDIVRNESLIGDIGIVTQIEGFMYINWRNEGMQYYGNLHKPEFRILVSPGNLTQRRTTCLPVLA